ncbi:3-hydroxyacyl-CoA dehydrogenase family protein [Adhaeribacter rhizoryzae]|uniref:3-hydroxyacyl-CoA dehydrogenase n=1 Tax=Adhaeribacter rhizoryzae TaxID=2607907 RepID=A0A5M6D7X1_9BACT|nr:3-hydroxyacyl-CoA dehydrogenase family protein [Adhaeribacter rhizoryzae]KAA5542392.1 3-hydroxyacyl-CoA dehydrogenase [Adhaeribacter rhizoryzae]
MQIVIVAPPEIKPEFELKFTATHDYIFVTDYNQIRNNLKEAEVVFDFFLADNPDRLRLYQDREGLIIFCQAVTASLAQLAYNAQTKLACTLIGFNGWPTFLNRAYLEVTLLKEADKPVLQEVCAQLSTEYLLVEDRVGMVTPRVLAMLINEAFYTLQENTATATDIDLAMKLGTNYPYGPFEWTEKVGIKNIYKLLDALYTDTRDERYKICPLLKKKYLQEAIGE